MEHLLELGYLRMTNLLPNEIYKEILCPTEIQYDMPIEHKVCFFRVKYTIKNFFYIYLILESFEDIL